MSEDEDESDHEADHAPKDLEDLHNSLKVVLQRQFFEALVRATAVKFSCGDEGLGLRTLS